MGTLLEKAYEGLDPEACIDYHLHLLNFEEDGAIHSRFKSWKHPFLHLLFLYFRQVFGVKDEPLATSQLLDRLIQLKTGGTYCLLAFDRNYEDPERSQFCVSNEFIFQASQVDQAHFLPVASIHPYRADALDELEKWASLGVKMIKWLPNVMGMDPSDPRCLAFYRKMADLRIVLLTHSGHESLVPLAVDQELGNPLRLRLALDQGVRVIMAHSATSGRGVDFDKGSSFRCWNFDLFLRLMQEGRSKDLLFGDLAGVTFLNRMRYLDRLLEEAQPGKKLDGRLVNGSDYPIPCCSWAISTYALQLKGHITARDRKELKEIFRLNPLLFDFVLKRTVRHTKTHEMFPKDLFARRLFTKE